MHRLGLILASTIVFGGCSMTPPKLDYTFNSPELDINIARDHKKIKKTEDSREITSATYKFSYDNYVYPLHLNKFYHLIYLMDNYSEDGVRMFSKTPLTSQDDTYELVLEFPKNTSLRHAMIYINKNINFRHVHNFENIEKLKGFEYLNDNSNLYRVLFSANRDNRTISVNLTPIPDFRIEDGYRLIE